MADSGLKKMQVDEVALLGGSTLKNPAVHQGFAQSDLFLLDVAHIFLWY